MEREPSRESSLRRFVGNISARVPEETLNEHRWALECFLDRLPEATGVSYDRMVFVVDGMRPHMYDPADLAFAETSAWRSLRETVAGKAGERGIEVVDLHPLFLSRYRSDGRPFESSGDNHWNALGHKALADWLGPILERELAK